MTTKTWADELDARETIEQAQFGDLKVDTGELRVWLSRMTIEDGAPYRRTVMVEDLVEGRWRLRGRFDGEGRNPTIYH